MTFKAMLEALSRKDVRHLADEQLTGVYMELVREKQSIFFNVDVSTRKSDTTKAIASLDRKLTWLEVERQKRGDAVDLLISQHVEDPDPAVKLYAAAALMKLDPAKALPVLDSISELRGKGLGGVSVTAWELAKRARATGLPDAPQPE